MLGAKRPPEATKCTQPGNVGADSRTEAVKVTGAAGSRVICYRPILAPPRTLVPHVNFIVPVCRFLKVGARGNLLNNVICTAEG